MVLGCMCIIKVFNKGYTIHLLGVIFSYFILFYFIIHLSVTRERECKVNLTDTAFIFQKCNILIKCCCFNKNVYLKKKYFCRCWTSVVINAAAVIF